MSNEAGGRRWGVGTSDGGTYEDAQEPTLQGRTGVCLPDPLSGYLSRFQRPSESVYGGPGMSVNGYGFQWGSMMVERTGELPDGRMVLTVRTPKKRIELYVTARGNVRVFEVGKGELKR